MSFGLDFQIDVCPITLVKTSEFILNRTNIFVFLDIEFHNRYLYIFSALYCLHFLNLNIKALTECMCCISDTLRIIKQYLFQ